MISIWKIFQKTGAAHFMCALVLLTGAGCTSLSEPMKAAIANAQYPFFADDTNGHGPVTLKDGLFSGSKPDGSERIKVALFDANKAAQGDIDKDGLADIAMLLAVETGGSGTFIYVSMLLGSDLAHARTMGFAPKALYPILLGDRIKIINMSIGNGKLEVNYLDRTESDPMSNPPTLKKIAHFAVIEGVLVPMVRSGRP